MSKNKIDLKTILKNLRKNFYKLPLFILVVALFLILLFPYQDLTGWVTDQVNKSLKGQAHLNVEKLKITPIPPFYASLTNTSIETPKSPAFLIKHIKVAPIWSKLLSLKLGAQIKLDDFYKGTVTARGFQLAKEGNAKTPPIELKINGDSIDLKVLSSTLESPVPLNGQLGFDLSGIIDTLFKKPPELKINSDSPRLSIPPFSLPPTMMYGLALPSFDFKRFKLRADLKDENFKVKELFLGNPGDPLIVKLKGTMVLKLKRVGSTVKIIPGRYDMDFDLFASSKLLEDASFSLAFSGLKKYETQTLNGMRYLFSVSGDSLTSKRPPRMSSLAEF